MKTSAMGSSKYEFDGSLDDDFNNRNVFYETVLSWPPNNMSDKERFLLITSDDFFAMAEEYYHKNNYTFTFTREGLRDRAINEVMKMNSFQEWEKDVKLSKRFSQLITETRLAGHSIYYVSKKGKWCLRFNYIYRDGKSVAFFEDSPNEALEKGIKFIKKNRIKDDEDEYRPYKMK